MSWEGKGKLNEPFLGGKTAGAILPHQGPVLACTSVHFPQRGVRKIGRLGGSQTYTISSLGLSASRIQPLARLSIYLPIKMGNPLLQC